MKSNLVLAAIAAIALPGLVSAKECRNDASGSNAVTITYLGIDARRLSTGQQAGKYQIRNGSSRAIKVHTYDGDPPDLYPLDATLQRRDSEGKWWDKFDSLDHPRAADQVTKIAPGASLTFYSLTTKEEGRDYRLGVRTVRNCWLYSQPFQFGSSGAKTD